MDEIGLKRGAIRLVPHTAEWGKAFVVEKQKLESVLAGSILKVEHIGSTAIPSIVAKPIVDIAITIVHFDDGLKCVPALEANGYLYKGENGIENRHYFRTDGDIVKFHLHMFPKGHEKLRDHLLFRDYLIAHPEEARKYNDLKLQLREQFPEDRLAYTEGKDELITDLLSKARKWA
ncbi:MAG: GrpB family protein [Bacteroidia bacterium]